MFSSHILKKLYILSMNVDSSLSGGFFFFFLWRSFEEVVCVCVCLPEDSAIGIPAHM